jgi:hypothetical protein
VWPEILVGGDHGLSLFQASHRQLTGLIGTAMVSTVTSTIAVGDKLIPIGNPPGTCGNIFCFHF